MVQMTCGLAYSTALSLSEIESWLDKNCPGDWTVGLADGDEPIAGGKKKFQILFERREDLDTFKGRFKAFEEQKLSGGGGSPSGNGGDKPKEKRPGGMLRPNRD